MTLNVRSKPFFKLSYPVAVGNLSRAYEDGMVVL